MNCPAGTREPPLMPAPSRGPVLDRSLRENETVSIYIVGAATWGRPFSWDSDARRARPPGRAAPPMDGRPRGSPLRGCKNVCENWILRAVRCAASMGIRKRFRLRRPLSRT